MGESLGSLEVGKKADLFLVNTQRANLVPAMRIVSGFVHNGQPSDIEAVMVDGQWVMREGKLLSVDEGTVIAEADHIGRRVWQHLLRKYPNVPFPLRLAPQ
jgi:cytosine/adenosine deaminase-related metal-dependent hydrolase